MARTQDLIDFDIIEQQKENIQALPSGRSAKRLAETLVSPITSKTTSPNSNDHIRAEYEAELANATTESDDPLDIWDRYVRWILDAYPSAQATPASQLHTVLERATKAFISSAQYKNDPRYLKLWLHYIHFFADAPRETFVFLARHGIGEGLALFYEEYAGWLEGSAGRWSQAEEVYKLGIERDARPVQRLLRKFGEFEQRRAARGEDAPDDDTESAIPAARPALAAKIDPHAAAVAAEAIARNPQAPRPTNGVGGGSSRPAKAKMQIFSDAGDAAPSAMGAGGEAKGWDTIGSLKDRKKENVMAPKPWAGETLNGGGKKSTAPKMAIFRDPAKTSSQMKKSHITLPPSTYQVTINPSSGKKERVHVDLRAIYSTPDQPGTELSFEEVWATNRGWFDIDWASQNAAEQQQQVETEQAAAALADHGPQLFEKLEVRHDVILLDENGKIPDQYREGRPKKKKVIEVNETQVIKAKLDSPSGPKKSRKKSLVPEPTMTIHTRAATDDIYDIFNAPTAKPKDADAEDEAYLTDGDYTSGAESTTTTRQIANSEAGDAPEEIEDDFPAGDEPTDARSEWSEFSVRKHMPSLDALQIEDHADVSDLIDTSDPKESFQVFKDDPERTPEFSGRSDVAGIVVTPVDEKVDSWTFTSTIPLPPEDYVHNPRPYRDPVEVANSRLPFMTPITERTESSLENPSGENTRFGSFKTPSRISASKLPPGTLGDSFSSPLREIVNESSPVRSPQPDFGRSVGYASQPGYTEEINPGRPIINDKICNPVNESVRDEILAELDPPLSVYDGFYDHRNEFYERGNEIRRLAKPASPSSSGVDKTFAPVVLQLADAPQRYTIRRKLGAGAFAPVYLVENAFQEEDKQGSHRAGLEALKMEAPPTPWEFHMMRLAHQRLGPYDRATESLSSALEMHLYRDEAFLFLPYHPHGTLLDVVNLFRSESSGVMDEQLAMFFTIELLRTIEALHAKGIMHGDLKPDNCLLRLDELSAAETDVPGQSPTLSHQWRADGSENWHGRGITLIDFGRAIDVHNFAPDVQFIADWPMTAADCAEMREARPWTWQIDYHGLAGIIHCLLFGKYIDTVPVIGDGFGRPRKHRIKESLKRYWQTEIWAECFEVLLNPKSVEMEEVSGKMPLLGGMRRIREKMERWLEENCRRGVGLRALVGRVETAARTKR